MKLASKFDVLRGWPREGAIDDTFAAHVSGGNPVSLPSGTVVTQQAADGSMDKATTPASNADSIPVWVVVEGNDDFSGTFLQKVVALRSNCELQLDPANFAAGSYGPGKLLSFNAGQFKVAASGEQVIAECLQDNSAVDGTLKIYFHGGTAKKV